MEGRGTVVEAMDFFGEGVTGIFGSSSAGACVSYNLERRLDVYLDEDRSRVGCTYVGRPIADPSDAQQASSIYIPLVPARAAQISERLTGFEAVSIPGDFPEAFTRIGTDDAHASVGLSGLN